MVSSNIPQRGKNHTYLIFPFKERRRMFKAPLLSIAMALLIRLLNLNLITSHRILESCWPSWYLKGNVIGTKNKLKNKSHLCKIGKTYPPILAPPSHGRDACNQDPRYLWKNTIGESLAESIQKVCVQVQPAGVADSVALLAYRSLLFATEVGSRVKIDAETSTSLKSVVMAPDLQAWQQIPHWWRDGSSVVNWVVWWWKPVLEGHQGFMPMGNPSWQKWSMSVIQYMVATPRMDTGGLVATT